MNLGPSELTVVLAIFLILLGLVGFVWALVDIANRPDAQWEAVAQSKNFWLAALLVSWVVCLGWMVPWVYLLAIRPKLRAAG
jgi:hypothetical protein